jgi:hypothetical protein
MIKQKLLIIVRAFIILVDTHPDNTEALAKAQADAKAAVDALEALKAENALTDAENAEVQDALNKAAAATPPPPAVVEQVAEAVPQTP